MTRHDPSTLILAGLLATIAVARGTRLITHDRFPPVEAFRRWWWNQTAGKGGWRAGWAALVSGEDGTGGCPFCLAPYLAAGNLALVYLSDLAPWWWWMQAWAVVSYAAAALVVRDEPPAED